MFQATTSARFLSAPIAFAILAAAAFPQAPFVKTTYGVAPVDPPLWARLSEALSDADIAKINLAAFAKGNKVAAWELGIAYMQGLGISQNFEKAEQMFRIGAVDADKKGMVGMFYAHGYFPKDLSAVERWYAAAGRPQDYFELAEAFKAAGDADKSTASLYYSKATALYLALLKDSGHPEVRRAQLELGNFVIDGIYSAGNDPKGRAQNLQWARMIAQELLGQKEYQIAVEYNIGQEDLPADKAMWLRYCKRAAAYNIDLAQHYFVEALNSGLAHDFSGYDAIAWTRLSSQKMSGDSGLLKAMMTGMTAGQVADVDAAYKSLMGTRERYGAYYPEDDPLRDPTPAALAAMDQDDPDVQLRKAFNLELAAANDEKDYQYALSIYHDVRNHCDTAARYVLGKYALSGANGVPQNRRVAEYWLHEAVRSGSKPAQKLLSGIEEDWTRQRQR
jgi:TPR repeat protein